MPNSHASGSQAVEMSVDAKQLLQLARVLRKIDDPTVLKSMRAGLRAAAKPIAEKAKDNASFSPSIAKSITIETAFTAKKSGVFISAKRNKMPQGHEALPGLFERGSKGNGRTFRHPVFGSDTWVSQDIHPFLGPAIEGQEEHVAAAIHDEITKAIKASGLDTT